MDGMMMQATYTPDPFLLDETGYEVTELFLMPLEILSELIALAEF